MPHHPDLDLETSLADWVIDCPESVPVFEELGIDYCCGGRSLEFACQQQNLDPHETLQRLQAVCC